MVRFTPVSRLSLTRNATHARQHASGSMAEEAAAAAEAAAAEGGRHLLFRRWLVSQRFLVSFPLRQTSRRPDRKPTHMMYTCEFQMPKDEKNDTHVVVRRRWPSGEGRRVKAYIRE